MQKIVNIASLVGCSLSVLLFGGAIGGYFYLTNEDNQEKIKQQIIESVMQNVPIPGGLTGPALPTKSPGKAAGKIGIPSF
jgi:hypothetical protein